MPQGQISPVLRFIRRVRSAPMIGADSDIVLLDRFVTTQNEDAFGALVERHGAMVLSVCRRVSQNLHDAEDAFQATFLVLARRAACIRKRGSLASWLYGVAFRVARKAQAADSRRRTGERQVVSDRPQQASPADSAWHELRSILDQELNRLPEKYRAPLVLCYLEGKTNEGAADQLGWTKGTVSGRLARARDLLRSRLSRRGLSLSAGMAVGLFGAGTAPAAVPGTLLNATVQAGLAFAAGKTAVAETAVALAEGVMRAMFARKCWIVLGVVLSFVLAGGGAGILMQSLTGDDTGPAKVSAAVPLSGQSLVALERGKAVTLRGHNAHVHALAFAPDGRTLASASNDQTIVIWDVLKGKQLLTLKEASEVRCLAFAPEGNTLAAGNLGGTVTLWNLVSGKVRATLKHGSFLYGVAYSSDGKVLASGGHFIKLWDPRTGMEQATLKGPKGSPIVSLALAPDGKTVAAGTLDDPVEARTNTGRVLLWDAAGRKELAKYEGPVLDVAFSPDGKILAASAYVEVKLWNVATGKVRSVFRPDMKPGRPAIIEEQLLRLAFSRDGKTLAVATGTPGPLSPEAGGVKLIDLATGKACWLFRGRKEDVSALALNPDGSTVATNGPEHTILIMSSREAYKTKPEKQSAGPASSVGGDPDRSAGKAEPSYLAGFRKLQAEMDNLQQAVTNEYTAAKSEKEREAIMAKAGQLMSEKGRPLAEKALALVRSHATDKEAVKVFTWVINYQPESPAANTAAELLAKDHLHDPQTLDTASRFQHAPMPWTERLLQRLADADLPRDRKALALLALAECVKSKAELPQMLKDLDPATMKMVEQRYGKQYLAELRAADPARLEAEAIRRFKEATEEYGAEKYGSRTIADYAAGALFEIRHLAVGKQAPDIDGEDIDGKKFKLSDYRGKVVVLDFWGNW